jgi:hypothetical protein
MADLVPPAPVGHIVEYRFHVANAVDEPTAARLAEDRFHRLDGAHLYEVIGTRVAHKDGFAVDHWDPDWVVDIGAKKVDEE